MIPEDEQANYDVFRDCLGDALIQDLTASGPTVKTKSKKIKAGKVRRNSEDRKKAIVAKSAKPSAEADAEDLGEFVEVDQVLLPIHMQAI